MPCFEPVLTILRRHRLGESVGAVDDAPQVDAEHALPALVMLERAAAIADAGIVHQHRDLAEALVGGLLQALHVLHHADVGRNRAHVGLAALGEGGDGISRLVQGRALEVGQHDLHAGSGERAGGGKADAGGAAGDDRDPAGSDGGM